MVLFAGEGDAVLPDPDDGRDDSDSETAAFERLALFDMGFEISDMPPAFAPRAGAAGEAGVAQRVTHALAAVAVASCVDVGFGDAADIGAAAEEVSEMPFLVAPGRHFDRAACIRIAIDDAILVDADEFRVFEGDLQQVGRLAIVAQRELAARCAYRQRRFHFHRPLNDVEGMDTHIGHHAAGVIPEVAEGRPAVGRHAEAIGVERNQRRRPQPEVPVEAGGRIAVRRVADAFGEVVAVVPGAH